MHWPLQSAVTTWPDHPSNRVWDTVRPFVSLGTSPLCEPAHKLQSVCPVLTKLFSSKLMQAVLDNTAQLSFREEVCHPHLMPDLSA